MKEYDTTLWDERYIDEKYGLEKRSAFIYFKMFLELGKARTLLKLSKKVSKNFVGKKPPKYSTLQEYSAKWKWYSRAKAYDEYNDEIATIELQEELKELKLDRIKNLKKRAKTNDNVYENTANDYELNYKQMNEALEKNNRSNDLIIKGINELENGGKKQPETVVNNTVENKILNKQETNFESSEEEAIAKEAAIKMAQLKKVEVAEDGD